MCILADTPATVPAANSPSGAQLLSPPQRLHLARQALAGLPVSELADQQHVSRKFVYQQLGKAQQALDQAFAPEAPDDQVLFYLPVTEAWLQRLSLALLLLC